jgi:hypothetical protein
MSRPSVSDFKKAFEDGGLKGISVFYREADIGHGYYEISGWEWVEYVDEDFNVHSREIFPPHFVGVLNGAPVPEHYGTVSDIVAATYQDLIGRVRAAKAELVNARGSSTSLPEPSPKNAGEPVTPALVAWIQTQGLDEQTKREVIAGIEERSAFGAEKYGQVLMSLDGRDSVKDAVQELIDALQYLQAARMKGQSLDPIKPFLSLLTQLS